MAAIVTVTPTRKSSPQRIGTRLVWEGTITGPASYSTGGDVLSPALLGMSKIDGGLVGLKSGRILEVIPQTDGTAKLKAYTGALVEVAATTDLSASAYFAQIVGR